MRPRNSFSARLTLALVLPMTAFALVLGAGGAVVTRQVVDRTADRLLAGAARAISETMTVEDGRVRVNIPPWALGVLDNPERDRVYYSVYQRGRLLTGYGSLPQAARPPLDGVPRFDYVEYRGGRVRRATQAVSLVGGGAPVVVSIAQSLDSRRAVRGDLMTALLVLEGLLIALAACLVLPAVRWNMRPLQAAKRQLDARRAAEGGYRPIDVRDVPTEIAPLLEAFNRLLVELAANHEGMRRFTADASHQMRTPLTILKTHLSLLEAAPVTRTQADREAIRDAREASDRLGRLLIQLLALARADQSEQAPLRVVDLAVHAGHAVEQARPAAARAGVALALRPPARAVRARLHPEFFAEMMVNLLDNALKYGGRRVEVSVAWQDRAPVLTIDDAGAGIPESDRSLAFGRFTRLATTQAVPGSGLGLSIVEALALRQGGRIELADSPLGGLRVRLRLRPPPQKGERSRAVHDGIRR